MLWLTYEETLGKECSDRTWRRIKKTLGIKADDCNYLPIVQGYAILRKKNPFKPIQKEDVERYLFIKENLPQLSCDGSDLLSAIQRLSPVPSMQTIYRWGREINCPFQIEKQYELTEVQKWIEKIASQVYFKTGVFDDRK